MKNFIDVKDLCKGAAAGLAFFGATKIAGAVVGLPKKIGAARAAKKADKKNEQNPA